MPHLSIEYSANLDARADIALLCDRLLETIQACGLFEAGAIRVRALRSAHHAVADRHPDNAFVDLNFRIGRGRSAEEKKRVGEAIFTAAQTVLAPLLEHPHFALSLEVREIDPDLSWKRNAMHARLRGPQD